MRSEIEILAPAGDYTTLKAALAAGADAVYAGGERFGARAYAKNFTNEELLSAIDYVHLRGKKLYLTVNTLVKEREFKDLYEYLLPFYRQGLDAVIVQDIGVMDYIQKQFPDLPIHASTQMTITNVISAEYLESLGVERIVPARELSLEEVKEIRRKTDLQLECFVHGALCYCYSGQCLLSSMIGGRSGNRGQCAQPCRLPYQVEGRPAGDLLSLKDLCAIQAIPDLIESGICSFKIEGRMKQPGYVATVTRMYRKYTDLYLQRGRKRFQVSEKDLKELLGAYQRRGYCGGYYYTHNGKEMLSLERPFRQEKTEEQETDLTCQEKINGKLILSPGKRVTLYLQCGEIQTEISGQTAERAAKQPVTKERVEKQMRKTGNTPFAFDTLEIEMDGDVFVPVQGLNELRRQGLKRLEDQILERHRRKAPEIIGKQTNDDKNRSDTDRIRLSVSAESLCQVRAALESPYVSRIYVEDALWDRPENRSEIRELITEAYDRGIQMYFAMARIFRKHAEAFYDQHFMELADCFDGVLVRNLESYLYVRKHKGDIPIAADSGVYQWNRYAKDWWKRKKIETATAPVELNRWELDELGIHQMEIVVYGYLPVMISAGCLRKNTEGCSGCSGFLTMKDRQNKKNIVKNECTFCYNVIYNSDPLMLHGQYKEVCSLHPKAVRLQFTTEDQRTAKKILELFSAVYMEGKTMASENRSYTKGHFKRGVK